MTTVLAALFILSTGIVLFSIFRNRHSLDLPRSETKQRIRSRIDPDSSGSLRENAIMAEIGRIINSSLNIEEVYECFAEEVRKLIAFDRISINLVDMENATTTIAHVTGIDTPGRMKGDIVPLSGTSSEEVIRTRRSLLIPTGDLEGYQKKLPALRPTFQQGFLSLMSVPLISKSRVIGVLHFRSLRADCYLQKDLMLAERVGDQITSAIANSLLFAEHLKMEDALRESERRFRDLYHNAPLGYNEYDTSGCITNVNRTGLEMLGYSASEMIGQPVWKFNVEEKTTRERIMAKLAGKIPPGRNLERTYRKKDGTTIPVLIEDRLILDEKEQISGIRSTIQDISDRKRVEKEMADLQEQLRQSQKMEAIGLLAGGIAHDFNNLLTVISGHSQLLIIELEESDRRRENIKEIQKAANRAAALTGQILAFSRRQILIPKVIDLNHVLRNMDKMLRPVIGEDIELVTGLTEDLGRIRADPGQIEQVIVNLAVNARDAMPNGGRLCIETSNVELDESYVRTHVAVHSGRYVMFSVSDTGAGMAPEVRERIFEPFYTTKEKGQGTGLGLSVVYGIVKQSGGSIWVYSEPDRGTTFKVYFPRVDEPVEQTRERPAGAIPRGSETLLIVEDDDSVRELAVEILEKQGYRVLHASNGKEALTLFEQNRKSIHLLVTDVVMPGMNGHELAGRLHSFDPEVKVLYMSGYTDSTIVHHGMLEKGVSYIQKPFTPQGLALGVRQVLEKSNG